MVDSGEYRLTLREVLQSPMTSIDELRQIFKEASALRDQHIASLAQAEIARREKAGV
jgi:hypothetical protein